MVCASQPDTVVVMSVILAGRLARADRTAVPHSCPIEATMRTVGTRSAMLLMREAAYGTTRFGDFARRTGLTDAVVAARLRELVQAGLLAKQPYRPSGQRGRDEYALTESGHDLVPVLLALAVWGAKHARRHGTPTIRHAGCGETVAIQSRCAAGHLLDEDQVVVRA